MASRFTFGFPSFQPANDRALGLALPPAICTSLRIRLSLVRRRRHRPIRQAIQVHIPSGPSAGLSVSRTVTSMHHQRTHAARASTSTHRCATSRSAVLRTSAAGSDCVCGVDYTDVARRLAFWTPRLRLALHAALRVGSTLSSSINRRVLSRHPLDQTELPSARPAADDLRDLIQKTCGPCG